MVLNLRCVEQQDASSLVFTWDPPQDQERVVHYLVEVQQYVQPEGERTLTLTPLQLEFMASFPGDTMMVAVHSGVGELILCMWEYIHTGRSAYPSFWFAAATVPYSVSVMPRNAAGCDGARAAITCFTQQGGKCVVYFAIKPFSCQFSQCQLLLLTK